MKQAILLDAHDIIQLKTGKPLTIQVGDSSIELSYRGVDANSIDAWTCPQCSKVMNIVSKGGHMKWHARTNKNDNKWTCPECNFKCAPQGRGPHMLMHSRKGNKK